MKTLTAGTQSHLDSGDYTLCICWKITRTDAVVSGFTNHDIPVTVDGLEYSAISGAAPTNIESTRGMAVDNLDINGILSDVGITVADIEAGLYDHAELHIFEVNYKDTTEIVKLKRGWLGEVRTAESFFAEFRSLTQALQQTIGKIITPDCPHETGDGDCTLSMVAFTFTGALTSVTDRETFADTSRTEADDYFKYGKLTMTSGANNGLSKEVKGYTLSTGTFQLFEPFPYDQDVADTYEVEAGDDKTFATCRDKFSNAVNFGGYPHVPTVDQVSKFGGQ